MEKARIIQTDGFLLAGMPMEMSLNKDQTNILWQAFMPRRQAIPQPIGHDLYSVEIYPSGFEMATFDNSTVFTKWAAVRVASADNLPRNMKPLQIPKGRYAVFIHHGVAKDFSKTAAFIYEEWLPKSGYMLDQRPHFEVMGKKYYGPIDPRSQEEVYIPVRPA
ncbi:GyrI-like domain-containing protein [Roseivirga sp. BDSF3-8]|uniref:GyrI-like domain-containing protein n=1 Tax=Roseivirga sp. BDSF3-8 TaxID=3241598 RepID=UPI003531F0C9